MGAIEISKGAIEISKGAIEISKGAIEISKGVIEISKGAIVVPMSDSYSRGPSFESSCCCFVAWAIFFNPHCHSSLSCINEYLAIDSGEYM